MHVLHNIDVIRRIIIKHASIVVVICKQQQTYINYKKLLRYTQNSQWIKQKLRKAYA